ncbi:MAG: Gfo/Idh/MocA family oxidoreductase [Planctomycetota bacterium]
MIRIGFLSAAHIHTKSFLERVAAIDDAEAALIWDDDASRGTGYADRFGTRFVGDLDAALNDPAVDAWIVTAENTRHLPLLERALPLGKPLMCEKPLVTTVDDLDRLRGLIAQHTPVLTNGYFMPHHASYRAAAAAIADGALGKITHARFCNAHHAAYGRWFDDPELRWFTDPALAGGGALMDMGAHAVHLLRLLFGPVEAVWATTRNLSGAYPRVDDWGVIEMRFASGVAGRAEAGWVMPAVRNGLEVVGEGGTLTANGNQASIHRVDRPAEPLEIGSDLAAPDRVDRLIAAARGELEPNDLRDDLAAALDEAAIMAAAYRASATGTWEAVTG